VELAAGLGAAPPSGLILAANSAVFSPSAASADMLGENEDWLHQRRSTCFLKPAPAKAGDGCPRVSGVGQNGVVAFTRDDIECLKQIIANKRAPGNAPPELKSPEQFGLRRLPNAYD
jgi:hypothetical protein